MAHLTRKQAAQLLTDAQFHLNNAEHAIDLARQAFSADPRERLRTRRKAVAKERARIAMFMTHYQLHATVPQTGPGRRRAA